MDEELTLQLVGRDSPISVKAERTNDGNLLFSKDNIRGSLR